MRLPGGALANPGKQASRIGDGVLWVPQLRDGPVTLLRLAMVIHFLLTDGPERKTIVALVADQKSQGKPLGRGDYSSVTLYRLPKIAKAQVEAKPYLESPNLGKSC